MPQIESTRHEFYWKFTFFPGLTSLKATSAAVLAAAITSAAFPVTGPSWRTWVCATTVINPSIWQPKSLSPQKNKHINYSKFV